MILRRTVAARFLPLAVGLLLSACASDPAPTPTAPPRVGAAAPQEGAPPFTLDDRLGLVLPADAATTDDRMPGGEFSFDYTGDVEGAVKMFAERYDLNVIIAPDVAQGSPASVSVSFKGLPFDRAMEALLTTYGYHWDYEGGLWRVYQFETRIFAIDYLRLIRQGTGSAQANLASKGGGGGSSSDGVTIGHRDTIDFWKELSDQLKTMLSKNGRLILNDTAGIVQVTDRHANMAQIDRFIKTLTGSAHRQVEIEVKIFEVTLNDHSALGIDWTRVTLDAGLGVFNTAVTYSAAAPAMFGDVRTPSMGMTYNRGDFTAVLSALKEQGELSIVSQPKITVLNNQPALIKVGTDQPYFTRQSNTANSGSNTEITYETNYITIGVVLSVTPQISDDGQVILNVTPMVSRLLGMETINNPLTNEQAASAPIIDVKQSSTLVRIKDDQMAVIAGLI
ncbi:MAG: secretin N-terminal domain-containing protein, partial [Nitrospinae bacterium]|nr:secretin N-terminal domain-containing protein [Nitrospinota bacterium]